MKKRFLLLSLTAILAACNQGSGSAKTIFSDVNKKIKISSATKEYVINSHTAFEMETTIRRKDYVLYQSGEEQVYLDQTKTYRTIGSLDLTNQHLKLQEKTGPSTYDTIYEMVNVNGKPKYTTTPKEGTNYSYLEDAQKAFDNVYDSIFYWEASYFAGCPVILSTDDMNLYMPKKVLQKNYKNFEIVVDEEETLPGTFYIALDDSRAEVVTVKLQGGSKYDYELLGYRLEYENSKFRKVYNKFRFSYQQDSISRAVFEYEIETDAPIYTLRDA